MKKVLSLVLAAALSVGMTTAAFAKTDTVKDYTASEAAKNIKLVHNINGDWTDAIGNYKEYKVGEVKDNKTTELETAVDGQFIETYIIVKDGTTESTTGKVPNYDGYQFVTNQMAKKWDLEVKFNSASTVFKDVDIAYATGTTYAGAAMIKYEFRDVLVSTGAKESKDKIYVYADGKKTTKGFIEVKGKLKNVELTIKEDEIDNPNTFEIDSTSADSRFINVKGYISKAEITADNDTIITTRLYKQKYYVRVSQEYTDVAVALMDKWSFNDYVKVEQIGLTDTSTISWPDRDGVEYVYTFTADSNYDAVANTVQLKYLGKSNAALPFAGEKEQFFFFSSKELDIEEIDTKEPTTEPSEGAPSESNPSNGPSDEDNTNANYNPNTGR